MTKRVVIASVAVLAALAIVATAWAHFTSSGSGSGTATVGSLNAPAKPSASANGTRRVDVGWHRATLSNGTTPAERYYVSRYSGTTLDGYACGTSPTGTTIPDSAADISGNFTCSDTGLTNAGPYTYTVTAVYKSFSAESAKSDPVTVSLFGPLDHFVLTAATTIPTAGVADNLTVTAEDASNNTVTSYTGFHNLTFSGASSIGSNNPTVTDKDGNAVAFGTATPISFSNGVAGVSGSSNGVMKLYKAETANITVAEGSIGSPDLALTVGDAGAASLTVSPSTTSPGAGSQFAVTVSALDQYSNPAKSNYTGTQHLDLSGPHSSPAPSSTAPTWTGSNVAITFNSSAVATIPTTLYDAETTALTAKDHSVTSITGTSTNVTVGDAGAATFTLTDSSGAALGTQTAGAAFSVKLTALDQYSNVAKSYGGSGGATKTIDYSGPGSAPDGTAPLYPTTATSVTFTNGVGTASGIKLFKAETPNLTAKDHNTTSISGTASFTVNAGTTTQFQVVNPGTQTAGTAFNVTMNALDSWKNLSSYTGTHTIAWSGPANAPDGTAPSYPSTATSLTFASGSATASGIKLFNAASTTLTATEGSTSGTSTSFTVNPATRVGIILSSITQQPTPALSITGAVGTTLAYTSTGEASNSGLTATAKVSLADQFRNPVANGTGSAITIDLTMTGSGSVTPAGANALTIGAGSAESSGSFTLTRNNGSGKTVTLTGTVHGSTQKLTVTLSS